MLPKTFFHQIEKQEEMALYLPGSVVGCSFMHVLFKKFFYNIQIQIFQNYSPRTGCLARYMSLF